MSYKAKMVNCQTTKKVVVGLWVQMEMVSQLCYYDYKVAEWFDANPGQEGEEIFAPDYWIELPD